MAHDKNSSSSKDILKWEEQMIKAGHKDLVRRKSLMESRAPSTTAPAAKKKTSTATKTTRNDA